MTCPNCGETLEGDGYTMVLHCPNVELDDWLEPDADPILCEIE